MFGSYVLLGFCCLVIIFLDISHGGDWPSNVIAFPHRLEPRGFDWIFIYRMDSLDGLFGGWEIVNAVGLAHRLLGLFGWAAGLPLPALL